MSHLHREPQPARQKFRGEDRRAETERRREQQRDRRHHERAVDHRQRAELLLPEEPLPAR